MAKGWITYNCMAPAVYRKLRSGRATGGSCVELLLPERPGRVGRPMSDGVVLGRRVESTRWQLRVDTTHPSLFDHPVDHVPGMLLMEAARQAALSVTYPSSGLPLAMACGFQRFVELDEPCWITVDQVTDQPDGRRTIRIQATQREVLMFTCDVEMGPRLGSGFAASTVGQERVAIRQP
jgi:2-oxo-3-(phosphooxy)propyl 3-oxoalkanoate synthase